MCRSIEFSAQEKLMALREAEMLCECCEADDYLQLHRSVDGRVFAVCGWCHFTCCHSGNWAKPGYGPSYECKVRVRYGSVPPSPDGSPASSPSRAQRAPRAQDNDGYFDPETGWDARCSAYPDGAHRCANRVTHGNALFCPQHKGWRGARHNHHDDTIDYR